MSILSTNSQGAGTELGSILHSPPAGDSGALGGMLAFLRLTQTIERAARSRRKAGLYHGPADFVLREGRVWTPARLPQRIRFGEPGQCYKNAFELALRHGLTYVEG